MTGTAGQVRRADLWYLSIGTRLAACDPDAGVQWWKLHFGSGSPQRQNHNLKTNDILELWPHGVKTVVSQESIGCIYWSEVFRPKY